MWLNKFLDMKDDLKELAAELKDTLKKKKLTPLEFTIVESVFSSGMISGYDLISKLNDHFAGTWEAKSGTIYPILSKLKSNGFLEKKAVKSPIGPIKKVYSLTKAGEKMLKVKVSQGFLEQIQFIENFLVELATIYIKSVPESEQKEKVKEVRELLRDTIDNVIHKVPLDIGGSTICPNCQMEQDVPHAVFCSYCGTKLTSDSRVKPSEEDEEYSPAKELNGEA